MILVDSSGVIQRQRGEEEAMAAAAQIGKTRLVPLTDTIALTAADVSLNYQ